MPLRPQSLCRVPGCLCRSAGHGLCLAHAAMARPSATERGYDRQWRKARSAYLAAHPQCERCGAPATEAHHLRPRRLGGSDDWSNLAALCKRCHSATTFGAERSRWPDGDR